MRKSRIRFTHSQKWSIPILLLSIFLLLLVSTLIFTHPNAQKSTTPNHNGVAGSELPELPRLAYLISGSRADGVRLKRLLQALYHPRNYYVLNLDLEAPDGERVELGKWVRLDPVMREFGNVMVIGKADLITHRGPTALASMLRAAAILLKKAKRWDWLINLSASDYPLMPQDDILHIFSYLPRDLNFLEHTSNIGSKEYHRARPIIIDPGLYHSKKSGVFWAKETRSLPSSFMIFMDCKTRV